MPGLASSNPGEIHVEELPELRNVLVVNNASGDIFRKLLDKVKCSVDFREAFLWKSSAAERLAVEKIQTSATNEDIVNLQFTRYFKFTLFYKLVLNDCVKWYNWGTQGCFGANCLTTIEMSVRSTHGIIVANSQKSP